MNIWRREKESRRSPLYYDYHSAFLISERDPAFENLKHIGFVRVFGLGLNIHKSRLLRGLVKGTGAVKVFSTEDTSGCGLIQDPGI